MEALILIPIAFIIYGWMQSIPAGMAPPPGVNGVEGGIFAANGFSGDYIENNDFLFANDDSFFSDSDSNSCDVGLNSHCFEDNILFDTHTIQDDMMFNPAYEWFGANIYHHDDDHFSDNSFSDTFSDPFSGINDSISFSFND